MQRKELVTIVEVRLMGRTLRSCKMKGTPSDDASVSRKGHESTRSQKHVKTLKKAERKFECLELPRGPASLLSANEHFTT